MLRLGAIDLERGANVAGHRGYYLTGPGVRLNQALINYGLDFLDKRNFLLMQPPFFMNKDAMAKTAQLDEFDEALYKVSTSGTEELRQQCTYRSLGTRLINISSQRLSNPSPPIT